MDSLTKIELAMLVVISLLICNPEARAADEVVEMGWRDRNPITYHVLVDGGIVVVGSLMLGNPIPALHLIGTSGVFLEASEFWLWSKNGFPIPKPKKPVVVMAQESIPATESVAMK